MNTLDSAKKLCNMISEQHLEALFYEATGLIPEEGGETVYLGTCQILDSDAGLAAVLTFYTRYWDRFLKTVPLTTLQRIRITLLRCFTFEEYTCLFNLTIKESDFHDYPIFRTLLISSHKERLLFIRSHDNSHAAFLTLLESFSKIHSSLIHTFIYEARNISPNF